MYYVFWILSACGCNQQGTLENTHCNQENGECYCKSNVIGKTCNACASLHYGFPDCQGSIFC